MSLLIRIALVLAFWGVLGLLLVPPIGRLVSEGGLTESLHFPFLLSSFALGLGIFILGLRFIFGDHW